MHDDLQRLTFDLLDKLSQKRDIQIVIATHSPTLIDAAGLEHVLLIDRTFARPLQAHDAEKLVPMLGDRGLALPPAKVMNTLKARRALFVEGKEADFEQFILACGEIFKSGFTTLTRGMTVFETGGATKQWPSTQSTISNNCWASSYNTSMYLTEIFLLTRNLQTGSKKVKKASVRLPNCKDGTVIFTW